MTTQFFMTRTLSRGLIAASLIATLGACSDSSEEQLPTTPTGDVACGNGGTAINDLGAKHCVFDQAITETGFECPVGAPHSYNYDNRLVVCSPMHNLEVTEIEQIVDEYNVVVQHNNVTHNNTTPTPTTPTTPVMLNCGADEIERTFCAMCGPTDGCVQQETVCAPACDINSDCDGTVYSGSCRGGFCDYIGSCEALVPEPCGDADPVTCLTTRALVEQDCPTDKVVVQRDGCYACVDPQSCSAVDQSAFQCDDGTAVACDESRENFAVRCASDEIAAIFQGCFRCVDAASCQPFAECPPDSKDVVQCSSCGPTDECLSTDRICAPVCTTQADCDQNALGTLCSDNACMMLCG